VTPEIEQPAVFAVVVEIAYTTVPLGAPVTVSWTVGIEAENVVKIDVSRKVGAVEDWMVTVVRAT
jgi:hypothetical protein